MPSWPAPLVHVPGESSDVAGMSGARDREQTRRLDTLRPSPIRCSNPRFHVSSYGNFLISCSAELLKPSTTYGLWSPGSKLLRVQCSYSIHDVRIGEHGEQRMEYELDALLYCGTTIIESRVVPSCLFLLLLFFSSPVLGLCLHTPAKGETQPRRYDKLIL